jgi:hypothetical protein
MTVVVITKKYISISPLTLIQLGYKLIGNKLILDVNKYNNRLISNPLC